MGLTKHKRKKRICKDEIAECPLPKVKRPVRKRKDNQCGCKKIIVKQQIVRVNIPLGALGAAGAAGALSAAGAVEALGAAGAAGAAGALGAAGAAGALGEQGTAGALGAIGAAGALGAAGAAGARGAAGAAGPLGAAGAVGGWAQPVPKVRSERRARREH